LTNHHAWADPTVGRELDGGQHAIVGYVRVAVPLRSGDEAWVYVFAG
jgi:hypothetical protein